MACFSEFRRLSAERVTTPGTGVDQTVLSISRTYDLLGRREFITSHSDADPDTSTFTDAVNQVQYTYNAFGALDKEYQEHEGKVDGLSLHDVKKLLLSDEGRPLYQ